MQLRIAGLLGLVARQDTERLRRGLDNARTDVMGPFSGAHARRGWGTLCIWQLVCARQG